MEKISKVFKKRSKKDQEYLMELDSIPPHLNMESDNIVAQVSHVFADKY